MMTERLDMEKKMNRAISYTVSELWERGRDSIPQDMLSASHLIYSSPATLSFNSPGAEGFGVKRAGLSVPGSVMLIVSPGCCGRNTSSISSMKGYEDRFFYLTMDETDLVTGRHLRRIPKAVCELAAGLKKKPSVIMICITCVDALLGTDMERVCRKAENMVNKELRALSKDSGNEASEEKHYVRVRPCYMYALTREGRKPPMVHVRQSIYSLLEPMKKKADSVNFMGYFAPVDEKSELRDLLRQIGVKKIREVSACPDYEELCMMAEANFNLVLNPEARPAAGDLQEKLGIPSIELMRLYQIDRIAAQYDALGAALGVSFDYGEYREEAKSAMKAFRENFPDAVFSVGEAINADPFELALALVRYGFAVKEIFGTLTTDSYRYIRHLAALSPDTKVYSNLAPSMLLYEESPSEKEQGLHIALGRDAGWYHPDYPCLQWGQDIQPFGFRGVRQFFEALEETARGGRKDLFGSLIRLGGHEETGLIVTGTCKGRGGSESLNADREKTDPSAGARGRLSERVSQPPKGYRKVLTPFAPDQSGAVSVFYELGGITVICDAGGCTGNICGFDEPRWFRERSAVFSAGLRDMDAILGRDDRLIAKLADTASLLCGGAAEKAPAFTSIIGTPVPAVIGTDFKALERMAEKKTGLPCLGIACDGMEYYDKGVEKAYLALFDRFAGGRAEDDPGRTEKHRDMVGILGAQYMDLNGFADLSALRELTEEKTGAGAVIFGSREDGISAFADPGSLKEVIVVTVSGYEAAKRLRAKYGIPFRCHNPLAERQIREIAAHVQNMGNEAASQVEDTGRGSDCPGGIAGRKILVIHEQVTANSCREVLRELGASAVDIASWFMMKEELCEAGDFRLREESDAAPAVRRGNYDMIIADPVMLPLIRDCFDGVFAGLPHFAVSGKL